jgi:hypothetical protein
MVEMLVANSLVLLANLGVLALTIKLYTEILKDKNMAARVSQAKNDG